MKAMNKQFILGIVLLAVLTIFAAPAFARPNRVINDNDMVVMRGNVHPHARPEFDVGRTRPDLPMERIILALSPRPGAREQLDQLLADQHPHDEAVPGQRLAEGDGDLTRLRPARVGQQEHAADVIQPGVDRQAASSRCR